ncbi:hypothetical protein [Methanoculleus oceani]|uniref:hypothetical protein n=1 Tax=Methanoculleus oceani TaxID=2184756 RepID=UPI0020342B8B|nr:hypothetical protein [Methanoculleus sp. CWC-02]
MEQRDPYSHIIKYLGLEGNNQLIDSLKSKISSIQETYYKSDFNSYDYDDPLFQAAYLMAYYPLYIDPIQDALWTASHPQAFYIDGSMKDKLGWEGKVNLDVSIYGGGAEPELLGLLKFINQKYPLIRAVRSHYIDNHNWENFRAHAYTNMVPDYWRGDFIPGNTVISNLGSIFNNDDAMSILQNSDVHVMQNCATDLMHSFQSVDRYVSFMHRCFNSMKEGSILIGIDVPLFDIPLPSNPSEVIDVRGSFNRIAKNIRDSPKGTIIKSPSTGAPKAIAPDICRDHPLVSSFNLKRTVKYHSFIAKRV